MRQRAMIAVALSCNPEILIADEPTTALDVTIQAQILKLLMDLRDSRGLSIILITHDLGVVAQTCDRIAVLRHGQLLETRRQARCAGCAAASLYGQPVEKPSVDAGG
jgi:peptide/nickel transport system ATP-binding protein